MRVHTIQRATSTARPRLSLVERGAAPPPLSGVPHHRNPWDTHAASATPAATAARCKAAVVVWSRSRAEAGGGCGTRPRAEHVAAPALNPSLLHRLHVPTPPHNHAQAKRRHMAKMPGGSRRHCPCSTGKVMGGFPMGLGTRCYDVGQPSNPTVPPKPGSVGKRGAASGVVEHVGTHHDGLGRAGAAPSWRAGRSAKSASPPALNGWNRPRGAWTEEEPRQAVAAEAHQHLCLCFTRSTLSPLARSPRPK